MHAVAEATCALMTCTHGTDAHAAQAGATTRHPQPRTSLVAAPQPHATVPPPPRTCSAFVTFLRSDAHSDEVLKSAAFAMRHSSKMQGSAAYDKERAERLSKAAVKVATDYAAKF